ncbi:hypothetical protein SDC9_138814 [bioreactor metagenome]|uniref:Uncharacterized protein n=1 Tax=bioreactor metagenome TaxID=1076179 RepID=A0A645DTB6_9ZZZZ
MFVALKAFGNGIPDKFHLWIFQSLGLGDLVTVHFAFLVHDGNNDLVCKLGQEGAFLDGGVSAADDHHCLSGVGGRVTGRAEGNTLVIQIFILVFGAGQAGLSTGGHNDDLGFKAVSEGFNHLGFTREIHGAHIGQLKLDAEFFGLFME